MGDIRLTPAELALRLRKSLVTLKRWRKNSRGPVWMASGRSIRYPLAEVEKWEALQVGRKLK